MVPVLAIVVEVMQDPLSPASTDARRQLEHRTDAVSTTIECRAIEIACGIKDHAGVWSQPVLAVVEAIQHPLLEATTRLGSQLEHGSAAGTEAMRITAA